MTAGKEEILIIRVGPVPEQREGMGPWDGRLRGVRARIAQAYGKAFVRGYARAFVRAYSEPFVRKYGRLCPRAYAEVFVPAFTEAFARSHAESFARAYLEGYYEVRAEANKAMARVVLGAAESTYRQRSRKTCPPPTGRRSPGPPRPPWPPPFSPPTASPTSSTASGPPRTPDGSERRSLTGIVRQRRTKRTPWSRRVASALLLSPEPTCPRGHEPR